VGSAIRGYLDHLSVERGLAPNTLSSYGRDLRRYEAFLKVVGVRELSRVSESAVREFVVRLREGDADHPPLREVSTARTIVAVRGLHRFAVGERLTEADPTIGVKPPAAPKRLPKALPISDVTAMITAASLPATALALRNGALLELLYGTGARISEAVGLEIDDLDREESVVKLRGKGGKERLVPVGSYALKAVNEYLLRGRPALVRSGVPGLFLNSRGGRLSRQSAWAVLVAAARQAGLTQPVSPHTLRHSFATHLLDGGADVRVVQELLGHASVTTTQVYTLVTVDSLREVFASAHPRARRIE
jgi:integrase/recombinase XerD